METASVFAVAKLSNVQAVSFHIVTDNASETGVAEWKQNINPLLEKLYKFLGDVIHEELQVAFNVSVGVQIFQGNPKKA